VYRSPVRRVCTAFWTDKRVLVTGASGFIGGAVARILAAAGADVHGSGCTRPPPPNVVGHRARLPEDAHALVAEVAPAMVLHLAAPVSLKTAAATDQALQAGIVAATASVAEAAIRASAHLVHISSCAVYEGGQAPFEEGQALHPLSPYGLLKLEAEHAVLERVQHGLMGTIVRPFRTYGPGCRTGLVAEACQAAASDTPMKLTDGRQIREWNHIDAIATGIVCAAQERPAGAVWNLGGGDRVSVAEISRRIFALAGRSLDDLQFGAQIRRPGEVDRFWGDHRRVEARWGPLASVDLHSGLRQTLAWHQDQRRSAR